MYKCVSLSQCSIVIWSPLYLFPSCTSYLSAVWPAKCFFSCLCVKCVLQKCYVMKCYVFFEWLLKHLKCLILCVWCDYSVCVFNTVDWCALTSLHTVHHVIVENWFAVYYEKGTEFKKKNTSLIWNMLWKHNCRNEAHSWVRDSSGSSTISIINRPRIRAFAWCDCWI